MSMPEAVGVIGVTPIAGTRRAYNSRASPSWDGAAARRCWSRGSWAW